MTDPGAGGRAGRWERARVSVIADSLRAQRRWVVGVLVAAAVYFSALAGTLAVIHSIFDDALLTKTKSLSMLVGQLVGLAFLGLFSNLALLFLTSRVIYQIEFAMRCWLYDRLLALDTEAIGDVPTGQIVTRSLTDLEALEALATALPILLVAAIAVAAIAIVMLVIDPLLAVVALLALPINGLIVMRMAKRLLALGWATLDKRAEVTTAIDEPVRGIRVLKAFGAEGRHRDDVAEKADSAFGVAMTRIRLVARFGLVVKLVPVVLDGLVIYIGAHQVVSHRITIGDLVIYLGFAVLFTGLGAAFDDGLAAIQTARSGSYRIADMIAAAPERPAHRRVMLGEPITGLTLEVTPTAGRSRRAVAIDVGPGRWVAVDAGDRAASSEIARAAAGFSAPDNIAAVLEGIPVVSIGPDQLHRAVRRLDAEPFLFGRTIRENLQMGAETQQSDADLWEAVRAAGAEDFVAAMPDGLDASVGERGLTLSGGQRQRLALARALVGRPRALVLDEALSAVNPSLEAEILGRVRDFLPEASVLLVNARDEALALVDRTVTVRYAPEVKATVTASLLVPSDEPLAADVAGLVIGNDHPTVPDSSATNDAQRPTAVSVLGPVRPLVAAAGVVLIVSALLAVAPDGLFKAAVDGARDGHTHPTDVVALIFIALAFATSGFIYIQRLLVTRIDESVLYTLRRRIFQRLSRLGIDFYDRVPPGQIASRVVYDLDRITEFLDNGVYPLLSNSALLLVAMVVLLVYNGPVFLVVLPLVPVVAILTYAEIRIAGRAYVRVRKEVGLVVERLHEDFTGREAIEALGATDTAIRAFAEKAHGLRQARRWATSVTNTYLATIQFAGALTTAALINKAGHLSLAGHVTIGGVVFLQLLLSQALAPLPALSGVVQTYLAARASLATLGEPFQAPILPVIDPAAVPCPALEGDVHLDAVTFAYPGTDRPVLHDVSLRLGPGDVLAVVGATGAGKSSLAKLLTRVYDPDQGTVKVDGTDIRLLDLHTYRRRLGVVPQEAFCFRGTVASNLRVGRVDATDAELATAIEATGGDELLSIGLGAVVEEEGRNLAPHLRQHIAIAAAWLIEPDILVLDEATSVLSPASEEIVVDAVRRSGQTAIVVTHRPNVARLATQVAVLDGGRLVESGTHRSLIRKRGPYAALWAAHAANPPNAATADTGGRSATTNGPRRPRQRAGIM